MYMEQSLESFENWRDSHYDHPEPDTEAPEDKPAQRARGEQSEPASPAPTRKHKKQEMER